MFIAAPTLDDLLKKSIDAILESGERVEEASRGANAELCGVNLRLTNPLARLSHSETKGKVFSPLGELAWYLSQRNDAESISYYIPRYLKEAEPDGTIHGAYGPRLFGAAWSSQFENILALLRKRPASRKAVIQLFDASDLQEEYKDVPCTCFLQFLIRDGRLNLIVCMRSNDVFRGLPHDVFAFTMIQEIVARKLGCDVGVYSHFAASLHLYDETADDARRFSQEGWQKTKGAAMPPMPQGDPGPAIDAFLKAETAIRTGTLVDLGALDDYWQDLVRLLQIFKSSKENDRSSISALSKQMTNRVFHEYVATREARAASRGVARKK